MTRHVTSAILIGALLTQQLPAITLGELQTDPMLTPKRFSGFFADFAYKYSAEIQPPEDFLRTQVGDCDDYAVLADLVLRPKGFGARLIMVRMPGLVTHAVCYVNEEKGYLDYNNRVYLLKIERAGPSLREIATKVAKSFNANWSTASEFTYLGGSMKRLVATVTKSETGSVAVPAPNPVKRIKVDF